MLFPIIIKSHKLNIIIVVIHVQTLKDLIII